MDGYTENLTFSMENSRNCLRRIARNEDTEFSNQNIRNSMEKFVKSVNAMVDTILVPCRLMDMKVGDDIDVMPAPHNKQHGNKMKQGVRELLNSTNLFDLYNMLKRVKEDLLWGQNTEEEVETPAACSASATKGHARTPSTVSTASTSSALSFASDFDSDVGNETDSGIEDAAQVCDNSLTIATNFKRHLSGLQKSLRQLTEVAEYLTVRYQHHVCAQV